MTTPAYLSEPQISSLARLLQEIMEGHLRLPLFQRDFVWDNSQRLDLLNSVREGIPIGSVLVWRTATRSLECFDGVGPHRLPDRPSFEGSLRSYLLDGLQRLTTLLGCIQPRAANSISGEGRRAIGRELDWEFFYDLEERVFRLPEEGEPSKATWQPLRLTLDGIGLLRFQRELAKLPGADQLIAASDELVSAVRDYKIPVLAIVTEDLEQATRIFHRINSRGTPMGEFHMMQALTWSEGFDLREKLAAVKARLKDEGWQEEPEEDLVLDVCKVSQDLGLFEEAVEELSQRIEERPEIIEDAKANLLLAIRFLREECGIRSAELLPSRYQLILLAEAMRVCPEPSEEVRRHMVRWFWLTTYENVFRAVTGNRLQRLLQHLRRLARGETAQAWGEPREIKPLPLPERFHFRSARSKVLAMRLASLQPYGLSMQPLPEPLALLARHGADAIIPLFKGRSESSNRIIVHPQEAQEMKKLLLEHPERCSQEMLASHGISPQAAQALYSHDEGRFLQERMEALKLLDFSFMSLCLREEFEYWRA